MLHFLRISNGSLMKTISFSNEILTILRSISRRLADIGRLAWAFTIAPSPLKMVRTLFGSGSVTTASMITFLVVAESYRWPNKALHRSAPIVAPGELRLYRAGKSSAHLAG
jgi:hypothetical protein